VFYGAWTLVYPKTIFLAALEDNYFLDNKFESSLPIIMHELYHSYQFRKLTPLLYMLLAFPILREFTLEKYAYKLSDRVSNWLLSYDQILYANKQQQLVDVIYGKDAVTYKIINENDDGTYSIEWKFTNKYPQNILATNYLTYIKERSLGKKSSYYKFGPIGLPISPDLTKEQQKILDSI